MLVTSTPDLDKMKEQSGIAASEKVLYAASPLDKGALLKTAAVYDGSGSKTDLTLNHFVALPADKVRELASAGAK